MSRDRPHRRPEGKVSTTAGTGGCKCGLFLGHNAKEIHCMHPVPLARHILRFGSPQDKDLQYRVFCCGLYRCCEWYQVYDLMVYGEEDE